MKHYYIKPDIIITNIAVQPILSGSQRVVISDEEYNSGDYVLNSRRNGSVWDDEEEDEEW